MNAEKALQAENRIKKIKERGTFLYPPSAICPEDLPDVEFEEWFVPTWQWVQRMLKRRTHD